MNGESPHAITISLCVKSYDVNSYDPLLCFFFRIKQHINRWSLLLYHVRNKHVLLMQCICQKACLWGFSVRCVSIRWGRRKGPRWRWSPHFCRKQLGVNWRETLRGTGPGRCWGALGSGLSEIPGSQSCCSLLLPHSATVREGGRGMRGFKSSLSWEVNSVKSPLPSSTLPVPCYIIMK